jgi:hypothetical protein
MSEIYILVLGVYSRTRDKNKHLFIKIVPITSAADTYYLRLLSFSVQINYSHISYHVR